MGNRVIGSLDLDTTSQGSVKKTSNMSSGAKFANALDETANTVTGIAGNLASVFPGGGAVLSAVASGLSSVTGSGPFGGASSGGSLGGVMGGGSSGGGFAGAMGGGSSIGGGIGTNANTMQGPMGNISIPANPTPVQMLQIQNTMQNQSQILTTISAIINMDHQIAMSIIQDIH